MKYSRIIILSIVFASYFLSCRTLKMPEYKYYDNLTIEKLGFKKSSLSVDLHYFNPNNLSVILDKTELDIYINDNLLGHSSQKFQLLLGKKSGFTIPLKFELEMKNILKNSVATLINKEVSIKIKGKIRIGKGNFFTNFPVDYTSKQSFDLL